MYKSGNWMIFINLLDSYLQPQAPQVHLEEPAFSIFDSFSASPQPLQQFELFYITREFTFRYLDALAHWSCLTMGSHETKGDLTNLCFPQDNKKPEKNSFNNPDSDKQLLGDGDFFSFEGIPGIEKTRKLPSENKIISKQQLSNSKRVDDTLRPHVFPHPLHSRNKTMDKEHSTKAHSNVG